MYPELPYEGLSWPITQHAGVLNEDSLNGLLNACLQCRGQKADAAIINSYLTSQKILTQNIRADSNQIDAWRDYQQMLSEFGLIYSTRLIKEIKLTPVAMAYLNKRLNYEELITLQIMRYQYPNGHKSQLSPSLKGSYGTDFNFSSFTEMQSHNRILVRPAVIVWLVLSSLWKNGESAVLSLDEMQNHVIRCTNHSDVSLCVESLLKARNGELTLSSLTRARRNAQDWFKIFKQTSLFTLSADANNLSLSTFSVKKSDAIQRVCEDLSEQSSFWIFDNNSDFKREWFDYYGDFDNGLDLIIKTGWPSQKSEDIFMDSMNIYENAAHLLTEYVSANSVNYNVSEENVEQARKEFQEQFSPAKMSVLSDDELLGTLFLTVAGTNSSLCYHLEFNPKLRDYFGSIAGGSSYKFGLFQRQQDSRWVTGSPNNPTVLTDKDALDLGKNIRDYLIKGYEIIDTATLNDIEDYEQLANDLIAELGQYASYAWVQKYYYMFFTEKLVGWYSTDWVKHFLYGLGIEPKSEYYVANGQLALVKKASGLSAQYFQEVCYKIFGRIRHFFRLGSSNDAGNYADDWRVRRIVAVGWNDTGDLINYLKDKAIDKTKLTNKMTELYYQSDARTASHKAGEIKTFYETKADDVFVVSDGDTLLGFVDSLTPYYFDANEVMAHCKKGTWKAAFNSSDRLPTSEGLRTTCVEIKKPENLLYLYNKYHNVLGLPTQLDNASVSHNDKKTKKYLPLRSPRQSKRYAMNVIIYGAPGTGKTYSTTEYAMGVINDTDLSAVPLNAEERKALVTAYKEKIKEGRIIFTTFHQSYGYEDFIQGLRPVTNSGAMTFANVDGIFKQIVDKAMYDSENNYVFIIDEINRANISKVFGELITLIETDKRWGESDEMSVTLPSGDLFAIPNNLYIVGTMNSADKSISLIDTALRRRFDFLEVAPNSTLVADPILKQVLTILNKELFEELDSTDLLVGHAYFISKTEADLVNIMNRNIIPLLYEYFFDNSKKVKAIVSKVLDTLEYKIESESVGRIRITKKD